MSAAHRTEAGEALAKPAGRRGQVSGVIERPGVSRQVE